MIVARKPDRNVIFSARMTYGTCDHHEDKTIVDPGRIT